MVWRNSKVGTGILAILTDASGQCVQGYVVGFVAQSVMTDDQRILL